MNIYMHGIMSTPMNVSIRKARPGDLTAISALNKMLFEYETIFNDEYNLQWTYSDSGQKYFKKRLESNSSIIFVAEVKATIVGYILAYINSYPFRSVNPIAEIENMFISEDYRKHGIGRKLMQEVKKVAKEKGVKRIKVVAVTQNTHAINFYKMCGFEEFDVVLEANLDNQLSGQ